LRPPRLPAPLRDEGSPRRPPEVNHRKRRVQTEFPMLPTLPHRLLFSFALLVLTSFTAQAGDWTHWRGPAQNGHSLEKGLPDSFDPVKKENVIWTAPYGGRSAPIVMDGRVYVMQGHGKRLAEAERVVCLEEKSGKKLWEYGVTIYHSDIVSSRLG